MNFASHLFCQHVTEKGLSQKLFKKRMAQPLFLFIYKEGLPASNESEALLCLQALEAAPPDPRAAIAKTADKSLFLQPFRLRLAFRPMPVPKNCP